MNGKTAKETIWLPNFFEGKDPFDGKQTDEKGLPAGGVDKRGAHVKPTTKAKRRLKNKKKKLNSNDRTICK